MGAARGGRALHVDASLQVPVRSVLRSTVERYSIRIESREPPKP
jgi:hypothetical protein